MLTSFASGLTELTVDTIPNSFRQALNKIIWKYKIAIIGNNKSRLPSDLLNTLRIITDEPTLDDALDFDKYSANLANVIRNSTPRFTIGIFGGWGTGKTTLMKMIEASLARKDIPLFNWQRILSFNDDSVKLQNYLISRFPIVKGWMIDNEFVRGENNKSIKVKYSRPFESLSISIDEKNTFASLSINGGFFHNEFVVRKRGEEGFDFDVYERESEILTVWFNAW